METDLIFWVFCITAFVSASVAALASSLRVVILSIWVCGMATGATYLSLGAEVLAIVQWIMATLVAISFLFFSIQFGIRTEKVDLKKTVLGGFLCAAFLGLAWIAVRGWVPQGGNQTFVSEIDAMGRIMVGEYLLPTEIVAISLFLVIVGIGVISRPEEKKK